MVSGTLDVGPCDGRRPPSHASSSAGPAVAVGYEGHPGDCTVSFWLTAVIWVLLLGIGSPAAGLGFGVA